MTRPDFTITADDARALAASARVCGRPMLRRVHDRATGTEEVVPIPCGSTREAVCPACARKARIIRIQQCTEGWHLTDEPDRPSRASSDDDGEDQDDEDDEAGSGEAGAVDAAAAEPARPAQAEDERPHRRPGVHHAHRQAVPAEHVRHLHPALLRRRSCPPGRRSIRARYDYRRAALDALHFSKLCGRLWSNLRRCAGFNVQYFSVIEAQKRGAPHLHATIRGAIPRAIFRQVVAATDYALWWPPFDQVLYDNDRLPEWTGPEHGYADPDTGEVLPTWAAGARPARHRPGRQAGARDAVRHAARPARRHPRARRPGRPLPRQVPHQSHRGNPQRREPTRPTSGTWTGCTPNSGGCRARRGARTGSATASNPTTPSPA